MPPSSGNTPADSRAFKVGDIYDALGENAAAAFDREYGMDFVQTVAPPRVEDENQGEEAPEVLFKGQYVLKLKNKMCNL